MDQEPESFTPPHDTKLWVKIVIGMVLGILTGLALSPHVLHFINDDIANLLAAWIKLPGIFFLGLIQMVVIPLILCSIILGITQSRDLLFLKKIGIRVVLYFVFTTFVAISIGMTIVHVIKPGSYINPELVYSFQTETLDTTNDTHAKTFDDLTVPKRIENMIPINLPSAIVERNLLQIVIAAMIFGIALLMIPSVNAKPILDICTSGQMVAMTVIGWAMYLAPYAVFGLLCSITIKLGLEALTGLGMYMITVILGLLFVLVFYVLIICIFGKMNPIKFFKSIKEPQLLAFSTSSSAATMPFTLNCAEKELNIDPKVSRFIIPLGATVNMDGTALYQTVAAVFLVHVFGAASGIELSTLDLILLMITTVGASIGTPATPGVGIAVLATILSGIGLNPLTVGFILGVDRILDMCRTTVNVTGDLTASVVLNKMMTK